MLTTQDMKQYFLDGIKPLKSARIGIELEVFVTHKDLTTLTENEVTRVFSQIAAEDNIWQLEHNTQGNIKGLSSSIGNVSCEPGLQLEFSSTPECTMQQLEHSLAYFKDTVIRTFHEANYKYITLGHHPFQTPETTPFFQSSERYQFMYNYMPQVGTLGRNMMKNTSTLQTNLDYSSEEDLAQKVQAIAVLTPFLIYLNACSPWQGGLNSSLLSYRTKIWEHTDPTRTGMPPFFFQGKFTLDKYIDYLLDIPVYFILRRGEITLPGSGYSFQELLAGKAGELNLTLEDFIHHAFTVFPDIRIKQFLEVRACDTSPLHPLATPALLAGLLYARNSLNELLKLTENWGIETFQALKHHLTTRGLTNELVAKVNPLSFAHTILELAHEGLTQIAPQESKYLQPVQKIVATQVNWAQKLTKEYDSFPKPQAKGKYSPTDLQWIHSFEGLNLDIT